MFQKWFRFLLTVSRILRFNWEINENLAMMKAEIANALKDPHSLLVEGIESAGYSGALANSLLAPASSVDRLDCNVSEKFVAEHYSAPRMVLAAPGVDHEKLLSIAEPLLSDLPTVSHPEEPKPVYVGDLHVLQQHGEFQSCAAFSNVYNNTSLFGIQATTSSDFVSEAIDIAARELIAVATRREVDQGQLDRAKQATKSAVLMHMESRMVASEDIGKQILTWREKTFGAFLKAVDEAMNQSAASSVKWHCFGMPTWRYIFELLYGLLLRDKEISNFSTSYLLMNKFFRSWDGSMNPCCTNVSTTLPSYGDGFHSILHFSSIF